MKKNVIVGHNVKENPGYSTILALLLIGFMIIVTTGIFNLVMTEMKDTKNMTHYLQSYAGAEAGIELAMLDIKNNVPLIDVDTSNPKSKILDYKIDVTYDFDAYTQEFNKTGIKAGDYALIDLLDAKNPFLTATSTSTGIQKEIMWNIVGKQEGMTGQGSNFSPLTLGKKKILNSSNNFIFSNQSINSFLQNSSGNYLIIYNPHLFDMNINLKVNPGEKVSKDVIGIKSSGISGIYKQNLVLNINKSGYFNFLKYSIFSL